MKTFIISIALVMSASFLHAQRAVGYQDGMGLLVTGIPLDQIDSEFISANVARRGFRDEKSEMRTVHWYTIIEHSMETKCDTIDYTGNNRLSNPLSHCKGLKNDQNQLIMFRDYTQILTEIERYGYELVTSHQTNSTESFTTYVFRKKNND